MLKQELSEKASCRWSVEYLHTQCVCIRSDQTKVFIEPASACGQAYNEQPDLVSGKVIINLFPPTLCL